MTIRNAAGARAVKARGRQAEQAVCNYLTKKLGRLIERRRLTGEQDTGDIAGWSGRVVEVKSCRKIDLAGWTKELASESEAATRRYGVHHKSLLIVKKRGTQNVAEWYALMPMPQAIQLLSQ